MELSCTGQQSKSTIFVAVIKPDAPGGVTLSSLLQLTGLMKPEVPQIEGSPNFLDIELEVRVRLNLRVLIIMYKIVHPSTNISRGFRTKHFGTWVLKAY